MNEWINVKDRKPPNDVYVLVSKYDGRPKVKMNFVQIAARYSDQWIDDKDGEILDPKHGVVTHWMSLPDSVNMIHDVEN